MPDICGDLVLEPYPGECLTGCGLVFLREFEGQCSFLSLILLLFGYSWNALLPLLCLSLLLFKELPLSPLFSLLALDFLCVQNSSFLSDF